MSLSDLLLLQYANRDPGLASGMLSTSRSSLSKSLFLLGNGIASQDHTVKHQTSASGLKCHKHGERLQLHAKHRVSPIDGRASEVAT
ncbi:hypothetical protein K474DRAFT_789716 [Panus rudis PR-1116 ss-1]|nr:hypothetical protein K474DRAFT_789716 [Panus rudis PR-1116 ss-1]